MMNPVIQQYIVDTKGNPTAVILSIENYKKILSIMENIEDYKETMAFSQSSEFIELIQKSLDDVRLNRVSLWKDIWDEL